MTGFKQAIPIIGLFCNDTSEAEALAKLTGEEVSFKDKALEFLGLAVGTVAFWWLGGPIAKALQAGTGAVSGLNIASRAATAFPKTAKFLSATVKAAAPIIKGATAVTAGISAADEATDEFAQQLA